MEKTSRRHAGVIAFGLLLSAVLSVTACANGKRGQDAGVSGTMNIDLREDGMLRNGTECDTYQVEEGQKGIISICISRVSGQLDIDVYPVDCKDQPNYTGRDLDSASFDVIVEEPGAYQVCFTATEFVGDYGINWKTEDVAGK